jgi:hypothetical protein
MSGRLQQPLSDIGKFYKQIDDFQAKIIGILQQLRDKGICDANGKPIDIDHEIKEIHKYYDKLILVKKANVRKAIELLYEYGVEPYAEFILTRNEEFFLGQVESIVQNGDQIKETYELEHKDLLFIGQICMIWDYLSKNPNTGNNVKNNIWTYVQVICLLAEKVTGQKVLSIMKANLVQSGRLS